MPRKKPSHYSGLEGDSFFDSPVEEYNCLERSKSKEVNLSVDSSADRIYPCYVYDKDGNLLRVDYPKTRKVPEKWTGRY